jgi:hypothetical protein
MPVTREDGKQHNLKPLYRLSVFPAILKLAITEVNYFFTFTVIVVAILPP